MLTEPPPTRPLKFETDRRGRRVSRASLLCLGYGLCSLFATSFPPVVSQYWIHAHCRSPPPRSGRAPLTHPAPNHYLAIAPAARDIAIKFVKRVGETNGYCSRNLVNFPQLK